MLVARSIDKARRVIAKQKKKGKTIGLVPTMGALHAGHLSLVRKARMEADFLAVSIFINPLQFGRGEDLSRYPRKFTADEALLKKKGVDLIFYPSSKIMYPKDFSTYVEETALSKGLCGRSRPGHFKGVTTVVAKLFNVVAPDIAYFGQKDFQQAQIIKRMACDLGFAVKIKILPIIREKDGLALSSRNIYLKAGQRKDALTLSASLSLAKKLVRRGMRNPSGIKKEVKRLISSKKARIDYIEIVDPETLKPLKKIKKRALLALAAYIGRVRLIDNAFIN